MPLPFGVLSLSWLHAKIYLGHTCSHTRTYTQVPPSVPANKGLKAIQLKKVEEFLLEVRDPLPFGTSDEVNRVRRDDGPPSYHEAMTNDSGLAGHQRSDSDLARELHAKLNAE